MSWDKYPTMANLLRKYRKARGLKQKDVAAILGLRSASRVSRWENGASTPTLYNVFRLAALYRVFAESLFIDHLHALREELKAKETALLEKHHPPHD